MSEVEIRAFSTLQFSTSVELSVQKIVGPSTFKVTDNGSLDSSDFLHGVRV